MTTTQRTIRKTWGEVSISIPKFRCEQSYPSTCDHICDNQSAKTLHVRHCRLLTVVKSHHLHRRSNPESERDQYGCNGHNRHRGRQQRSSQVVGHLREVDAAALGLNLVWMNEDELGDRRTPYRRRGDR